jgi:hypothetical protein
MTTKSCEHCRPQCEIYPTFVTIMRHNSYCYDLKLYSEVRVLTPLYPIPTACIRPGTTGSLSIACEVVAPNINTR